jgi:hypothetical protein
LRQTRLTKFEATLLFDGNQQIVVLENLQIYMVESGMGEISKQRQLNEKKWYRAVRDLGFF